MEPTSNSSHYFCLISKNLLIFSYSLYSETFPRTMKHISRWKSAQYYKSQEISIAIFVSFGPLAVVVSWTTFLTQLWFPISICLNWIENSNQFIMSASDGNADAVFFSFYRFIVFVVLFFLLLRSMNWGTSKNFIFPSLFRSSLHVLNTSSCDGELLNAYKWKRIVMAFPLQFSCNRYRMSSFACDTYRITLKYVLFNAKLKGNFINRAIDL